MILLNTWIFHFSLGKISVRSVLPQKRRKWNECFLYLWGSYVTESNELMAMAIVSYRSALFPQPMIHYQNGDMVFFRFSSSYISLSSGDWPRPNNGNKGTRWTSRSVSLFRSVVIATTNTNGHYSQSTKFLSRIFRYKYPPHLEKISMKFLLETDASRKLITRY